MKMISRLGVVAAILCFSAACAGLAQGAAFPHKPVKVVTGGAAGALIDAPLRAFSEKFRVHLGQPVVVENRPGASELVALNTVSQAEPDGYTLFFASSGLAQLPAVMKAAANVDVLNTLAPVSRLLTTGTALIAGAKTPFQTIEELVAYMKKNPGKVNQGIGAGPALLEAHWFSAATRTETTFVRYASGAQARQSVMSGETDWSSAPLGSAITARDTGKARILVVNATKRHPLLPDVPALGESALPELRELAKAEFGTAWMGFFVPARTPRTVIASLHAAVVKTGNEQDVVEAMRKFDMVLSPTSAREFGAFFAEDTRRWKSVAKAAGLEAQ